MTRYFDSSAIVPAYTNEPNALRSRRLLADGDVVVCRLTEVEIVAALARYARAGVIPPESTATVLQALLTDFASWTIVELSREVTAQAKELLFAHSLRASDAVQLASALIVQRKLNGRLREFVTYDRRLIAAARAEGLNVSLE